MIESERLLVKVAEQMERFDTDICAVDATLQEAPKVLNTVCVYATINILHGRVYYLMRVLACQSALREQFIGVEGRTRLDMLLDFAVKCLPCPVRNDLSANLSAALKNSHHCGFVFAACASDTALFNIKVHIASLTAYESFVSLTLAAHLLGERASLHSKANTLEHEPRGFLSDANGAMDFIRTNAVFAIRNHPNCGKPLVQTERRIFENGSDLDAELAFCMGALALPLLLVGKKRHIGSATSRANNSIGPSAGCQIVKTVISISKVNDCLLQCLRGIGLPCHSEGMIA